MSRVFYATAVVELLKQLTGLARVRPGYPRADGKRYPHPRKTESVGLAIMRIEETVRQLIAQFALSPEDLNLDLGPLGRLR